MLPREASPFPRNAGSMMPRPRRMTNVVWVYRYRRNGFWQRRCGFDEFRRVASGKSMGRYHDGCRFST